MNSKFTYTALEKHYRAILDAGYTVYNCYEYFLNKKSIKDKQKILVNRIDIDFSITKVTPLVEMFNRLGIKGSFFIRLHAKEYNPFAFENYRIIKQLIVDGHELGYHSEVIDQAAIWNENAKECLMRDIEIINKVFNIKLNGVASHGGMTGLNNLDFWKTHKPKEMGISYEAYDEEPEFGIFNNSFYISDSEWTSWKCYANGKIVNNDHRTPTEHLNDNHPLIYFLIHPDTYFNHHFYES